MTRASPRPPAGRLAARVPRAQRRQSTTDYAVKNDQCAPPSCAEKDLGYGGNHDQHPLTKGCGFPPQVKSGTCIIIDPMLATGGSTNAAIDRLKDAGAESIVVICIVMVFVPIKYIYVTRTKFLRRLTVPLTAVWATMATAVLWQLPHPNSLLVGSSLAYFVYYFCASVYVTLRPEGTSS